ncbi:MAG: hypothetical protein D6766_10100 [Verrucomicrobia bacterium]|nr:MAG: hypothetical protein D6766_10100 [Verrucomicrobiota bacterium]
MKPLDLPLPDDEFPKELVEVTMSYLDGLVTADWEDPDGPIRLRDDLTEADLESAKIYHDLRLLLQLLEQEGGANATAKGNLCRAFVRLWVEHARWPAEHRELMLRTWKIEWDIPRLHHARILAEFDKLIIHRKKRWILTKKGRDLLLNQPPGVLYRRAFLTMFRKLDITYFAPQHPAPILQDGMGLLLWEVGNALKDWRPIQEIPRLLLPDSVLELVRSSLDGPRDRVEYVLMDHILRPLGWFGLVEHCEDPSKPRDREDWGGVPRYWQITPLYSKFIQFKPPPLPGSAGALLSLN